MNVEKFYSKTVSELAKYKNSRIISALSGGIDSSVATVLVSRAVGKENLMCYFVDTGLMRHRDRKEVELLAEHFGLNLTVVDASEEFFCELRGIEDPEQKRSVIGRLFIQVFETSSKPFNPEYLVQGTIAPDWIESGKGRKTIKSHHNVGGLPEKMNLKIIEPLRDLYKHEVRQLAEYLGFPEHMLNRQPFPGPGLAVRVLGEVTKEKVRLVREATRIVEEEVEKNLDSMPWQYFAVLLPVKTVGVKGDERAYNLTLAIRIVESLDGMTANFSHVDYSLLSKMSTRITNELPEIGRVLYDITNKPPSTIEFE